jgi:energy-coupling factor transporter ATP-binding protein EcfA2
LALTPTIAQAYIGPQQNALARWTLFHRDIEITSVYVQEVLELSQQGVFSTMARSPPISEASILRDIRGKIDKERQVWVILGDAGSGKSTMLRHWVLTMLVAHENQDMSVEGSRRGIPPIPIFLSLRLLSQQMLQAESPELDDETLAAGLAATIPEIENRTAAYPFVRFAALRDGQSSWLSRLTLKSLKSRSLDPPEWVLLLDGFDEMDPDVRPRLLQWVRLLPRAVRVVLTSRPGLVGELSGIARSAYYKICDFNIDQIDCFVHQWFLENQPLAAEMMAQIRSNEQLGALGAVPLLLSCLCMDVEARQNCHYSQDFIRATVYRRIVGILLHEWDATKAHHTLNHREIEFGMRLLSELAVSFSYDKPMRYHELWLHAQPVAASLSISKENLEVLLQRIINSGRLLTRDTSYGVSFGHKAFYDFFFAEGVGSRIDTEPNGEVRG